MSSGITRPAHPCPPPPPPPTHSSAAVCRVSSSILIASFYLQRQILSSLYSRSTAILPSRREKSKRRPQLPQPLHARFQSKNWPPYNRASIMGNGKGLVTPTLYTAEHARKTARSRTHTPRTSFQAHVTENNKKGERATPPSDASIVEKPSTRRFQSHRRFRCVFPLLLAYWREKIGSKKKTSQVCRCIN